MFARLARGVVEGSIWFHLKYFDINALFFMTIWLQVIAYFAYLAVFERNGEVL